MPDPRLNSLHLDPVRRQDYRRAREILLHSRGEMTLCAEQHPAEEPAICSTFIQNPGAELPENLICWLVDKEFLYPLKIGLNTMGRSNDNDIVVQDSYVSRRHCAILMHSNKSCEVHDTASKNGTYLNGSKISAPTLLKPGDEIRICDKQFVFFSKPGTAPSPPTHTIAD
jgi:hypothetical protein